MKIVQVFFLFFGGCFQNSHQMFRFEIKIKIREVKGTEVCCKSDPAIYKHTQYIYSFF